MHTATKILSTTVATAALLGFSGLTGVALADDAPAGGTVAGRSAPQNGTAPDDADSVHATETRTFTVTNLTGQRLRLAHVSSQYWNAEQPPVGTIVRPGGELQFYPTWVFLEGGGRTAQFDVLDDAGNTVGQVKVWMHVDGFAGLASGGEWTSGRGAIATNDARDRIGVLEAAGTVHELSGQQAQAQAEVLERFAGLNSSTSTFVPTGYQNVLGPRRAVGDVVFNNTPDAQKTTITASNTVGETDNLQVSAALKASILKVVEATVTTTYSHQWTSSHTFTQAEEMTIRPYAKGWLEAADPYLRYSGDYRVTLGNTTWILHDVHFDVPNPHGLRATVKQTMPMTEAEKAAIAPELTTLPIPRAVELSGPLVADRASSATDHA